MKVCRVLLTTECVNNCSYCCNKFPEIKSSFKMTTFDELISSKYDVYNISGGEPLLVKDKMMRLAKNLSFTNPYAKLYLYTSGYAPKLTSKDIQEISKYFVGVNISIHREDTDLNSFGDFDTRALIRIQKWQILNKVKVHIYRPHISDNLFTKLSSLDVEIKCWKTNECDNIDDDRFVV